MKTLLIEGKSGKVLQVLDKLADMEAMPEILSITRRSSDGLFYPAADVEEKYRPGDIIPLDFLLVKVNSRVELIVELILVSEPTEAEIKATGLTLIVGIKGQHKIGDLISL